MQKKSTYKRVLLKITGEALQHNNGIFNTKALTFLVNEIKSIHKMVELAIVIGGGNIIRGKKLTQEFRTTPSVADQIGMVATIINALILQDFLEKEGLETKVLSSIEINALAEPYIIRRAIKHLEKGKIVIFAAGTGKPGVTTDTAAILKALDIQADIVMKGTKVDGIFDSDPTQNPRAKFLPKLTYAEFLKRGLSVILDRTAVAQAEIKKMPILVFNLFKKGNLLRAINQKIIGSKIA